VYNGHRIKVDLVDMVETMKILKKEVWSYRSYNKNLIIYLKDYNHINTQLL
jgi:hypothetical protein